MIASIRQWKLGWSIICKIVYNSYDIRMDLDADGKTWVSFETESFLITDQEKEFLKSWDNFGVMERV